MKTEDILLELSKGSNRRPRVIDDKTFNENWDRIYGKKKKEETKCRKRKGDRATPKGGSVAGRRSNW